MNRNFSIVLSLAVAIAASGSAAAQTADQGPFGFREGMTRQEIVKLVGESAVASRQPANKDLMTLHGSPVASPAIEVFTLVIPPTQGLVKLLASGKDIATSDTGIELQQAYSAVLTVLSKKYGKGQSFDTCPAGNVECEPQFYMVSLKDKNRKVATFWDLSKNPVNGIVNLMLEEEFSDMNSGYLHITYEFSGFDKYADTQQAKQDSAY
jgi:hypothetical protein